MINADDDYTTVVVCKLEKGQQGGVTFPGLLLSLLTAKEKDLSFAHELVSV